MIMASYMMHTSDMIREWLRTCVWLVLAEAAEAAAAAVGSIILAEATAKSTGEGHECDCLRKNLLMRF